VRTEVKDVLILVAKSNMARKLRRTSRRGPREEGGSILLTGASLGLIVLVTLWPFDFSVSDTLLRSSRPILLVGWGRSSVSDVLLNAGLFMPFGFGLASLLIGRRRLTGLMSLAMVFGVCFAVSYAVEVLQQFMLSRYPALRDVLANSFGGILGWSGLQSHLRLMSKRRYRGDAGR
jgi:glycopeptide antibiotics resistance protein